MSRPLALAALLLAFLAVPAAGEPRAAAPWHGADPEMERFVSGLLARMTLAEKIGQMNLLTAGFDVTGPTLRPQYREDLRSGRVGAIFNAWGARHTRELQQLAVEETRLGIPLLFGYDVIHGFRTVFPLPLGEAASWDLEAIERTARVAAVEAAAAGVHWTFAPMVDIARDPRWGRISEGAGEDVFLGSRIAAARVRGFQGADPRAVDTLAATAKHYAAYGHAQAGRDYHTTDMSERVLRDVYLPPFKAAVDAGVATFMTAFNDLNGVPVTANEALLEETLRRRWAFGGFVVSDYTSINELVPHGYARDEKHAALLAARAGVDMDMQGTTYARFLADLVEEGELGIAAIDASVRRILELKYRLGLFEDPYRYSDEERERRAIYHPRHLETARDMGRKSIVLLQNEGVLPLSDTDTDIAVIGPLADSRRDMIGSWSAAGEGERAVSLLEGIRARTREAVRIRHARGAGYGFDDTDRAGFAEALAAARRAEVVIAAMGERWDMTGEAASRSSLGLPGAQRALLEELQALGKPIVLVVLSGRPLALTWEAEHLDAIVYAWYPGTEGGHAIADVLYGDYNPAGKLPVTFPRNVGQVPIHHDVKNTGRPYEPEGEEQKYRSRYLDAPNEPLYPFGYGLSYTRFEYSEPALDKEALEPGETLNVSVRVTNAGERDGTEVVQLYVRDHVGSATRPVLQLADFRKVFIAAGETVEVAFELAPAQLAFHRRDMRYGAEAGEFSVFVGGNSRDLAEARFRLTADVDLR